MAGPVLDDPRNHRVLALWIFRDEIKGAAEVVWKTPLGFKIGMRTPIHKHEGFLEVANGVLTLFENDNRKDIPLLEIRDPQVSFDKNFKRSEDSRGVLPPLHFSFGDDEVYIFTLGSRYGYWQGKNAVLLDAISGHS